MGYAPESRVACPNLQDRLVSLYELNCDPSLMRTPAPLSDFLWSDTNRSGLQLALNPGNGKLKTVTATYDQRFLESEVTASDLTEQLCVATTKRGNLSTEFSIDPTDGLKVEEKFNTADWIYACEQNDDIIVHEIQKMLNALYEKNATRITQRVAALLGNWDKTVYTADNTITEGGVKYLKIQTKRPSSFLDINPDAMEDISFAIEQTSFCQQGVVFSGRSISKYAKTMNAGCCSSQGIALDEMLALYGQAVVYDRRVQRFSGGPDYAWVIMPKALQPVYYTANNDKLAQAVRRLTGQAEGNFTGANYWKTVVQDPESGMPADFILSDNCGTLSAIMRNVVDVKPLPLDMFAPGDDMEGVRFVTGLKVENA